MDEKRSNIIDLSNKQNNDIMTNTSEEEIFKAVEDLGQSLIWDTDIKYEDLLGDYDLEEEGSLEIDKNRIKGKTFNKLGLNQTKVKSKPEKKRSGKWLVAAALLIIMMSTLFSRDVIAGIIKVFQYIPGINMIVEDKGDVDRYVLRDIVRVDRDGKSFDIVSVMVENEKNLILVSLRGEGEPYQDVSVEFKDGRTYNLSMSSAGGGGSTWHGDFMYEKRYAPKETEDFNYKEGQEINIILGSNNDIKVPVVLKRAEVYESYEQLGPTAMKNGLSITAIPKLKDGTLRVNLLTPLPNKTNIYEYGLSPDHNSEYKYMGILNEGITLKGSRNNVIKAEAGLSSYMTPLDEFTFDIKNSNLSDYSLVIPYVKMAYVVNRDIKIDVPRVGETINLDNNVFDFNGYKLKINSIERRKKDEVTLKIDTNYDETKEESLYEIKFWTKTPFIGPPVSKSWRGNYATEDEKVIGPMKEITIFLKRDDIKKLTINIWRIITVKRGPWEIKLK